jgi:transcriptional regulator with XRE-family HTH domain
MVSSIASSPTALGERIRVLRTAAECRQSELAALLGVDPSAISRIESGDRALSVGELGLLADYFQVSTERLLRGRQEPFEDALRDGDSDVEEAVAQMRAVIADVETYSTLMS